MALQIRSRKPLPDRKQLAEEWAVRGYSCGLWIDPPGREWVDFVHSTDELVLVAEGRLRLEIEDEVVELGPGDEALIPGRANHSVYNIGGTEARWYYGYRRRAKDD